MTIYEIVKEKLEKFPEFRERRFRDEKLVILALRATDLEELYQSGRQIPLKDMAQFAKKYDSFRHEYDRVMIDCPHLQGEDYPDKKKVVQQVLLNEFHYEPGYHQDVKLTI